jgi:hypothetical protein
LRGWAAAGPAGGDVPIGLYYQAPARCPSASMVADELAARGLRVTPAGSPISLGIAVDLTSRDAHVFGGRLTVDVDAASGKPSVSQAVSGRDCRAVVLSLVVVAALAVNATAAAPPIAPAAPADESISRAPTVERVAARRPTWFVGASGRGMTGLGADPALGVGASIERVWGVGSTAALSVVFSASTVAPPTITLPTGSASLRAFFGRLESCWFGGVLAAPSIVLSPCAALEGGVVQGTGNINRPGTATRPWFAPAIAARGAVRLTRVVWFSFDGAVFAPLVRDTFVFNDPRTTIHRTPAVGANLELGLGAAFW